MDLAGIDIGARPVRATRAVLKTFSTDTVSLRVSVQVYDPNKRTYVALPEHTVRARVLASDALKTGKSITEAVASVIPALPPPPAGQY